VRRWLRFGYVVVCIVVIVNMAANFGSERFPAMLPMVVVLAGWPFVPVLNGYAQARQWQRLNPPGHRTLTITIDQDRFRSASFVGGADVRWPAVRQVVETRDFFLIYVTDRHAHYLPKRALAAGDLSRVRENMSSQMDEERVHFVPDVDSDA
jgi:hypothetical protein